MESETIGELAGCFVLVEVIQRWYQSLQGFKLIYSLLGVAHADLTQGLVLVSSSTHVLHVQNVVLRLLGVIPCVCQLRAQGLHNSWSKVNYQTNCVSLRQFGFRKVMNMCINKCTVNVRPPLNTFALTWSWNYPINQSYGSSTTHKIHALLMFTSDIIMQISMTLTVAWLLVPYKPFKYFWRSSVIFMSWNLSMNPHLSVKNWNLQWPQTVVKT